MHDQENQEKEIGPETSSGSPRPPEAQEGQNVLQDRIEDALIFDSEYEGYLDSIQACRDEWNRKEASEGMEAIKNLKLSQKQSVVDLLFCVQTGAVSCRCAATEIVKQFNGA